MSRLPSSRLGRSMPESARAGLLCHPIPFVMRRVACDLRAPRAGGCEREREKTAPVLWNDGTVWWAAGATKEIEDHANVTVTSTCIISKQ